MTTIPITDEWGTPIRAIVFDAQTLVPLRAALIACFKQRLFPIALRVIDLRFGVGMISRMIRFAQDDDEHLLVRMLNGWNNDGHQWISVALVGCGSIMDYLMDVPKPTPRRAAELDQAMQAVSRLQEILGWLSP